MTNALATAFSKMPEETESLIPLMDGDSESVTHPVHLPGDVKHVKLVTSSPCHQPTGRYAGVSLIRNGASPHSSPSKSAMKKQPTGSRLASTTALSHQDGSAASSEKLTSSPTQQASPAKRRLVTETGAPGDTGQQHTGSALLLPGPNTASSTATGQNIDQSTGENGVMQQQTDTVSLQSSVGTERDSDGTLSEKYLAMRGSPNKTTWLLKNWHDSRPSPSPSSPRLPAGTGRPRYAARVGSGSKGEEVRSYRSVVSRYSTASSSSRHPQMTQQRVVEGDSRGTEIVVALGIVVSGAVCLLVSISGGGGVWTAAGVASVSIGGLAMTVGILRAKYNKQVEKDTRRMHIELLRTRSVDTRSSDSGARLV